MNKEDDTLRAAYNRARENSGGRLKTWWDRYLQTWDYYMEHGSYEGISVGVPVWPSFVNSARSAYKKGNLSTEQIMALREIDFPFQPMKTGPKVKPTRDSKLKVTTRLHEISQTVIPLTDEESDKLKTNIEFYQDHYNNGSIAQKTAERLDLKLYR